MGEVAELQRGIAATSRGLARARIAERMNDETLMVTHDLDQRLTDFVRVSAVFDSTGRPRSQCTCPDCRLSQGKRRPEPRHYLPCPDCNDTGLIRENVLTGWLIQGTRTRTCHCTAATT